jgi:hypothetical protein
VPASLCRSRCVCRGQLTLPATRGHPPDASAVLFPGCTGSWIAQTLSCEIIRADPGDRGIVSDREINYSRSHSGTISLEVSPDGGRLAFYSYPEELIIMLNLGSLEVIKTIDWSGVPGDASLGWFPHSIVLAVSEGLEAASEVILLDLMTGEERAIPIPNGYAYCSAAGTCRHSRPVRNPRIVP